MKQLIFTYLFFCLPFISVSQEVDFQWAGGFGTTAYEFSTDIVSGSDENVYLVGGFVETIDFDLGEEEVFITSNGSFDCFILKVNALGEFV